MKGLSTMRRADSRTLSSRSSKDSALQGGLSPATSSMRSREPFHFGETGQTSGLHPERTDYGTFASFSDPDGNGWLLQEVTRDAPAS